MDAAHTRADAVRRNESTSDATGRVASRQQSRVTNRKSTSSPSSSSTTATRSSPRWIAVASTSLTASVTTSADAGEKR